MRTHPVGPTLQEGAGAALRVFFRLIVPGWTFDEDEQARLLAVPPWHLAELRAAAEASDLAPLPDATLARLGFLVAIHASLTRIFGEPSRGNAWMWEPNPLPPFGGATPRARLLAAAQDGADPAPSWAAVLRSLDGADGNGF